MHSDLHKLSTDIRVNVDTQYLSEQSSPEDDKYVFAYTITIANDSDSQVQLLNRYWLITDADGKKAEVKGPGVVGEQPVIASGESYCYTSGAVLKTPIGTMQGHYEMVTQGSESILVDIPVFRLADPKKLN